MSPPVHRKELVTVFDPLPPTKPPEISKFGVLTVAVPLTSRRPPTTLNVPPDQSAPLFRVCVPPLNVSERPLGTTRSPTLVPPPPRVRLPVDVPSQFAPLAATLNDAPVLIAPLRISSEPPF